MSDKRVVVTISKPVKIGLDVWNQVYTSRVFSVKRPIKDVFSWAEDEGFKDVKISDLQFSEYTGESI